MNYKHIYMLIISRAKSEEKSGLRKKKNGEYYESHHILPKSLFPNWSKRDSNTVLLTAREHFFCHQLLTKIYPCREMYAAFHFLCGRHKDLKIKSSRNYANNLKLLKQTENKNNEDWINACKEGRRRFNERYLKLSEADKERLYPKLYAQKYLTRTGARKIGKKGLRNCTFGKVKRLKNGVKIRRMDL